MIATARQSSARYERIWTDYTVEVDAPIDEVRAWLMDVDRWVDWVPGLRALRRLGRGALHARSHFWMKLKMPSVPALWVPCQVFVLGAERLEWGGGLPGTAIRHRFELVALPSGGTRVRQVEYATNALALILRPFERSFRAHDVRWSKAIAARFAAATAR